MNIRKLKIADLEQLLSLYKHLHAKDVTGVDPETIRGIWDEICTNPNVQYFGLFEDELLVSSCNISITPNLTRGGRPYALIENVVTHTDYRKRGFGKAILKHCLDYAWSQNCYKAMLMTGRLNESTFRFYESAGFDRDLKQAFIARP